MEHAVSVALHDALAGTGWLAVNALLAWAAWSLARRLFPSDSSFQQLLHSLVIGWAYVVGGATLLGALGILTWAWLLATVAAIGAATLLGCRNSSGRAAAPRIPSEGGSSERGPSERWWLAAWGVYLAIWLGYIATGGLLEFPQDWDSLMYHIPLIDQWLQAKSLYAPDDAVWYNPGNNELIGLWMVAPFSGDFLIGLANLPAALLLALGTLELASQCGLRAVSSHLAAFVAVSNYVVLRQLLDSENDLAAAGLFVAGLAYSLRQVREGDRGSLVLGAAAGGLLAGVKYYSLGYAGLIGLTAVALTALARGLGPARRVALIGAAGMLLWGGYWYLRNLYYTGALLYPRGFSPSDDLLSEMRPDAWGSTLLGNPSPEVMPLLIDCLWQSAGAAHLLACGVAPGAALWLLASAMMGNPSDARRFDRLFRPALALSLVGTAVLLGVTPFAAETTPGTLNMLRMGYLPLRFGLCFLTLSVLAFMLVLSDLQPHLERFASICLQRITGLTAGASARLSIFATAFSYGPHVLFAAAGLSQVYQTPFRTLPGSRTDGLLVAANLILLATCAASALGISASSRRRVFWLPVSAGVVVTGIFVAGIVALGQHWHAGFATYYDQKFRTKVFTNRDSQGDAQQRTCVLDYRYYPFFGSSRQFRVSRPMWVPTYVALLDYIGERNTAMIVSINHDFILNGRYLETKAWLDEDTNGFSCIETDRTFSVYAARHGTGNRVASTVIP